MKLECIISSGYDPIKSEETDDEDCKDIDDTSNSHKNISIKEEAVKVEVKTEDDASTDDKRSPEYFVSSSSGYDPVKSEETDDEDTCTDTDKSNSHENLHSTANVKAELKTKDEASTDDECSGEIEEVESRRKSSRRSVDIQRTKKRHCSKRKREVDGSVKKTARIECSVEGCSRKAAGNGRCKAEHKGYNLCIREGCTKKRVKGGVCIKHGASWAKKICSHDGCTNIVVNRGVCTKHGAKKVRKTCKHEGCANKRVQGGVCMKHGAVVKTCNHEGCTKHIQKGGLCKGHYKLSNGESVAV